MKLKKAIIKLQDNESISDAAESIIKNLEYYSTKHPEFSYSLERNVDTNRLILKTIQLEIEEVN
jgi:hypothetical protein